MADLTDDVRNDNFVVLRATSSWPWIGAEILYDPAKVGEIDRDAATESRRYQIHRTPGTNNVESWWLRNVDDLEVWLMVKGVLEVMENHRISSRTAGRIPADRPKDH